MLSATSRSTGCATVTTGGGGGTNWFGFWQDDNHNTPINTIATLRFSLLMHVP